MPLKQEKKECKVFISHSEFDAEYASALVQFLSAGVGVEEDLIFCSSTPGHQIPLGVNFNDYILQQIKGYDAQVIALISNNYYNSKFCLYELGAAWGLCKEKIIPILIDGMRFGELQAFISQSQAIKGDTKAGVDRLADHFRSDNSYKLKNIPTAKFESERNKILEAAEKSPVTESNINPPSILIDSPYKAVLFDFDGTILQGPEFRYSWKEVWQHLGYPDKLRKTLRERHLENDSKYGYQEWCDDCAKYFIAKGFNYKHIKEIFKNRDLKVSEGFVETIKLLKDLGFLIGIISGGINSFLEEAIQDDHVYDMINDIYINDFIYGKDEELVGIKAYQNIAQDGPGKVQAMHKFCKKHGITAKDVVFVGEGNNDSDVAGVVGLALSFPAGSAAPQYNENDYVVKVHDKSMIGIIKYIIGRKK